jgi:OOP family OmpA-OmpF porin
MAKRLSTTALTILISASLTAQADEAEWDEDVQDEGKWYISQLAVYTDDDGARRLDDSIAGGEFRIGWKWTDTFALEGNLGYHKIDGWPEWPTVTQRQSQDFLDLGVNLVSSFNPQGNLSPYLLFGAGYLGTETELGASDSSPSGTAGLGLKVRFGDSPWSLRAEWRMRHAFGGDNSYTDQLGSLGVRYSFGGSSSSALALAAGVPETVAEADTDGDSVVDSRDACPNTPLGIPVNQAGCPMDSDRDGVADNRDQCADTGAGVKVDASGCDIIELKPAYFEIESAVLSAFTKRALDESAAILARNPDVQVEIGGHADSSGPEDYNMKLSLRRAEAVRQYLQQAGVDPKRLTIRGYGELQPIASNETILGRADNRRVELKVLDR